MNLPTGSLTFCFTDIEGSTQLWEQYPDAMRIALARHDALLRQAIEAHHGHVFKTMGDAFYAVFADAVQALEAALAAQRTLHAEAWEGITPLRVRIALHTGPAEAQAGDYLGITLNRAARLLAIGHGGQILLSRATATLIPALPEGGDLRDLGLHRLKDLQEPEQVFQAIVSDLPADFPPLRSLNPQRHNLPVQMTSFVGREEEIAELKRRLVDARLLTLTGPGGIGKTRLALQAAADALETYPDGIWLVELAPLADAALLPQAVAPVLKVEEEPERSLLQTLGRQLQGKRLLLILDNCEHLIEACANLADALLRLCPDMTILATSRERLGIAGEAAYPVPTLALPDRSHLPPASTLAKYAAIGLFVERAAAVVPAFAVTPVNAPALAQVCQRLDGIPLAIELAAARVRALSVEQIATRLDDRFRLLTGGSRTALPRQQTLRALIDWSYDLLNAEEQLLFGRLSVFQGGWTLEAVEAVCGFENTPPRPPDSGGSQDRLATGSPQLWGDGGALYQDVLDLLTSLVDKSLVVVEERDGQARYRLLDTLRQYAREKLTATGQEAEVRTRHRDFYLALVEQARPAMLGPDETHWLNTLEVEHDNLRAALQWSLEEPGSAEPALLLGRTLWRLWHVRGYISEGRQHLTAILQRDGAQERTPLRANLLNGAGILAWTQGHYATSRACYEEALSIHRERGDRHGIAIALGNLGIVAFEQGDYESARAYQMESLKLDQETGDKRGMAASLNSLGIIAKAQGHYEEARDYHTRSLALRQEMGDPGGIAASLTNLADVTLAQGDLAAARDHCEQALRLDRERSDTTGIAADLNLLGALAKAEGDYAAAYAAHAESLRLLHGLSDKRNLAITLHFLAELAQTQNRLERAAILYGVTEALRESIGAPLTPNDRKEYDTVIQALRTAMDEAAFKAAWAKGRTLPLEQAVSYALEDH